MHFTNTRRCRVSHPKNMQYFFGFDLGPEFLPPHFSLSRKCSQTPCSQKYINLQTFAIIVIITHHLGLGGCVQSVCTYLVFQSKSQCVIVSHTTAIIYLQQYVWHKFIDQEGKSTSLTSPPLHHSSVLIWRHLWCAGSRRWGSKGSRGSAEVTWSMDVEGMTYTSWCDVLKIVQFNFSFAFIH